MTLIEVLDNGLKFVPCYNKINFELINKFIFNFDFNFRNFNKRFFIKKKQLLKFFKADNTQIYNNNNFNNINNNILSHEFKIFLNDISNILKVIKINHKFDKQTLSFLK